MDNFQHGAPDARSGTRDRTPTVPGYVPGRELGRGGSSTVWLVKEESSQRSFALKCFTHDGNLGREDAIRRELRILSALDHQHLVKAYDVVRLAGTEEGQLGLVMDLAAGGSLAHLVATRGTLSVGETVTVLTPIAQALAYLHHNGFTHSDVSPGNVLFTGQGKPLLADLGVTRMVGDAEAVTDQGTPGFTDPAPIDAVRAGLQPERDVYSIAALGWYCLTGSPPPETADRPPLALLVPDVPRELAAALEAGLHDDRRQRPTAREFSAAVFRSAKAVPVDLAVSVHPTVMPELLTRRSASAKSTAFAGLWRKRRRPRQRRAGQGSAEEYSAPGKRRSRRLAEHGRRRSPVRGVVALSLLSLIAAAAWLWPAGQGPGAEPRTRTADTSLPVAAGDGALDAGVPLEISGLLRSLNPEEAVRGLAWLRASAFSSGRFELLNDVNVKGSPAEAADRETARGLLESGHVLAGFSTTLSLAETEAGNTSERAVVGIIMATSAYEEKDSSGSTVAVRPASEGQKLRVVLNHVDGRWQVQEILPA